jgi:hypothetical protein
MFDWKYALVLVEESDKKRTSQIYELYPDSKGEWTVFADASINSVEDVEKLYNDVKRDGTNTWFYKNGRFLYNPEKEKWEWVEEK